MNKSFISEVVVNTTKHCMEDSVAPKFNYFKFIDQNGIAPETEWLISENTNKPEKRLAA